MASSESRRGFALSLIVSVVSAMAAGVGLFLPALYRDNPFVVAGWFGNDLVTLLIASPLLAWATWKSVRGSARARLVQLGLLHYALYNDAFYLFGAALNPIFLLYVTIFALSIAALVAVLTTPDVRVLASELGPPRLRLWVGCYMVLWALALGGIWILQSLDHAITGKVPHILVAIGHPNADVTNLVAALDLSLLVPPVAVGAIWLLWQKPWGYLLAAVMNVSGAAYTLVLAAASYSASRAGFSEVAGQIPLWLCLTAASVGLAALLLARAAPANVDVKSAVTLS
jgi:hypothetical protein